MSQPLVTPLTTLPTDDGLPTRKSIRKLRWFATAFERQAQQVTDETGVHFAIDMPTLAGVFVEWTKSVEAQKPSAPDERVAYVSFAAGLMLRGLIRQRPLTITSRAHPADPADAAQHWPEGYAYVSFCLNGRALVLAEDFQIEAPTTTNFCDCDTWWSFKENVEDDPNLAIAFFDLFTGDRPNWQFPQSFQAHRFSKVKSLSNNS
ncbi:MAG: hypothetical protein AAGJ94_12185 [Pseudomonadota bacterium]